ncbi:MAG: STAS domain-containing protein [SAR324 cluster bacterium]|nr:STAS domain-containing protein [SAR324 cluster bacterium]
MFDSSGIGAIVTIFKKLQQSQKKLVLCELSQKLTGQLTRIRLDKLLSIYSTKAEILASFQS